MSRHRRSKQYTDDEIREQLLKHVWAMIGYWRNLKDPLADPLEGLAFSILATLDGSSLEVPAFQVIPFTHPDDAQFNRERGMNFYPQVRHHKHDIGGGLHELFHDVGRKYHYIEEKPRLELSDIGVSPTKH